MHPSIRVSAGAHIRVFGGQRTTLAISPYIPICFNGASCCFTSIYTRLASPQISCLCFRLYLGTLGLQMNTAKPDLCMNWRFKLRFSRHIDSAVCPVHVCVVCGRPQRSRTLLQPKWSEGWQAREVTAVLRSGLLK